MLSSRRILITLMTLIYFQSTTHSLRPSSVWLGGGRRRLPFLLPIDSGTRGGRRHVHLSGRTALHSTFRTSTSSKQPLVRPPNPFHLLSLGQIQQHADRLGEWIQQYENILVITGAGLSTESGIPDYRGHTGSYHEGHTPVLHDQFISKEAHRKRYWGRSMFGWDKFHQRQPNQGHYALSALERMGYLGVTIPDRLEYHESEEDFYFGRSIQSLSIITQNVDRLHDKAGSRDVVELHGRSDRVVCMNCGTFHDRDEYQQQLRQLNQEWFNQQEVLRQSHSMRPDGDAELRTTDFSSIIIPPCSTCETGFVKPDVVFFGDSVPKSRVALCRDAVEAADAVLVIGSSLAVHSANRHVVAAHKAGKGIAVLNVGPTRADELEGIVQIEAPAGPTLSAVTDKLIPTPLAASSGLR